MDSVRNLLIKYSNSSNCIPSCFAKYPSFVCETIMCLASQQKVPDALTLSCQQRYITIQSNGNRSRASVDLDSSSSGSSIRNVDTVSRKRTNENRLYSQRVPPGQIPNDSIELSKALENLNVAHSLYDITKIAESVIAIAEHEAWDIRLHQCHSRLLTKIGSIARESINIEVLIDICNVLFLFPPSPEKYRTLETIAQQLIRLDKIKQADVSKIIIILCKCNVKGLEYLNWIKEKLDSREDSDSLLKKIPSEDLFRVLSSLDRWAPGSFLTEINSVRKLVNNQLLMETEFDKAMKLLNILRPTGLLSCYSVTTMRNRYLDLADSLKLQQKSLLFCTCARLRLFSWKSIRPLLFPHISEMNSMSAMMVSQILVSMTLIMYGDVWLVQQLLTHKNLMSLEFPGCCVDVAYAICFYQFNDHKELLNTVLRQAFSGVAQLKSSHLMRLHEINAYLTYDIRASGARLPPDVLAMARDIEKGNVQKRCKGSDSINLSKALTTLPEECALNCEINVSVGPYHAQLVDEKRKRIDYADDPTTKLMRHRHFRLMGYQATAIAHWDWIVKGPGEERGKLLVDCLNSQPIRFILQTRKEDPGKNGR